MVMAYVTFLLATDSDDDVFVLSSMTATATATKSNKMHYKKTPKAISLQVILLVLLVLVVGAIF